MRDTLLRPYEYYGICTNIVDGDTIDVVLDLGFHLAYGLRLRLHGIDAPEKRGAEREAGVKATLWLAERIYKKDIKIETFRDKTGKYGRMVAVIYRVVSTTDGKSQWANVNVEMVEAGQAKIANY